MSDFSELKEKVLEQRARDEAAGEVFEHAAPSPLPTPLEPEPPPAKWWTPTPYGWWCIGFGCGVVVEVIVARLIS